MFNFGSTGTTTLNKTSLFGTSTPTNQNKIGTNLSFGSATTTTQPSTFASAPFGSTNLFGKKIKIL